MQLLHITTHMGGGIGRAISSLVTNDQQHNHRILCLDRPKNRQFIEICVEKCIDIFFTPKYQELVCEMERADVCVLHWWGHPSMAQFLANFPQVKIRVVLWSHVNGLFYPWLSPKLIEEVDVFLITSQATLENAFWSLQEREIITQKAKLVYGLGDLSSFLKMKKAYESSKKVRIGYLGSFTKSKIHTNFVSICEKICKQKENIQFILVGEEKDCAWILKEAEEAGIGKKLVCTGYISDVRKQLKTFDIFIYPLNPKHFATTENAILEAMAMGLPVVLLNQSTEKYIITHMKEGILANTIEDFVQYTCQLISDSALRRKLGNAARERIIEQYVLEKNIVRFNKAIDSIKSLKKHIVIWSEYKNKMPFQWLLAALPPDLKEEILRLDMQINNHILQIPILWEPSKGSIPHFYSLFPQDQILDEWMQMYSRNQRGEI